MMTGLTQDIRYALRQLRSIRRDPSVLRRGTGACPPGGPHRPDERAPVRMNHSFNPQGHP